MTERGARARSAQIRPLRARLVHARSARDRNARGAAPRSLFARDVWARAAAALAGGDRRAHRALVALDLDGTLAPIVARPERVRVAVETTRLLKRLARKRGVTVALVSARRERDLKRLLPVRGVRRIAEYGIEGDVVSPRERERFRRGVARVAARLEGVARAFPGSWVEIKEATVALHDRKVPALRFPALKRALAGVTREARRLGFAPARGRRVTDFVPRGYDKGEALLRLRRRLAPDVTFYFGDSEADEPAFAALGPEDFPVRVGSGPTRARYRVRGPGEVARFVRELLALPPSPVR